MIIRFQMKTPDIIDRIMDDNFPNADDEEKEKIREQLKKWFLYGEYLALEYDPVADKMTVHKIHQ